MHNSENENEYYQRIEKLYYKLCTVSALNRIDTEIKIIHEIWNKQTLAIGLMYSLKIIVETQNSKTLEVVQQLKVVELNLEIKKSSYRNEYLNNRNNKNLKRPSSEHD